MKKLDPSVRWDDGVSMTIPHIQELLTHAIARRKLLKLAAAGMFGVAALRYNSVQEVLAAGASSAAFASFTEIPHEYTEEARVPEGYAMQPVIRWGDGIFPDAPAFNPLAQTAESQLKQLGYNCDYVAFMPLPKDSINSQYGLLCVNHEYVLPHLMFPNVAKGQKEFTDDEVRVQMAAVGHSVVEVKRAKDGPWQVVKDSPYNRRISALGPVCELSGPVAGHARVQTEADPSGRKVIGTFANCAGGVTPWGTVITAEENFDIFFTGTVEDGPEKENHARMGMGKKTHHFWAKQDARFDVSKTPNEPNRYGWLVEFDPYDANSVPKKRTALGRFKHEAASIIINGDGRVVVYTGDDEANEYLYKFVSKKRFVKDRPNPDILDEGTLYVARFAMHGKMRWIPLEYGEAPLNEKNGFHAQADVLIEARRAAQLMGATPMDRPEDVEVNPVTSHVFVNLTNNIKRIQSSVVSPRTPNIHGHILEITPPRTINGIDHAQEEATWDIFLLAGNPIANDDAMYPNGVSEDGWLSCPDNMTFDNQGNIWIATDGMPETVGMADGLYVAACEGEVKARPRHFFNAPKGAEVCGPYFTPNNTTLFLSVQHPGDDDKASFANPSTRWPDFDPAMPPRPSVIAITKL